MRAIIYTRVSNDPTGVGRSTADQEAECRAICQHHGWTVAEVLCDNDIGASRWSGKERPAYQQLASILRSGDVLVTWEASRAQRDLAAYLRLRELCASRGVQWCYSGRLYDLADGDDRFTTGLDALLAEKEAEQIRARVLRGKRSAAAAGRPSSRPPFGFQQVRDIATGRTATWEHHPGQAPLIAEAVDRLLAGETVYAVVADFNARGALGPNARPWRTSYTSTLLRNPSYAGLRVHRGQVVGAASWPPIIDPDQHRDLVALLTDPRRLTPRAHNRVRHLLAFVARCGVCGAWMKHYHPASLKTATYTCGATTSCVRRRAELVEHLVVETLLARLETVDPSTFQSPDPDAQAALAEARDLRARLDGFTDQAADGGLSPAALARIEARLLPQIAACERRAARAPAPFVAQIAGAGARAAWEAMTVVDRRRLIGETLSVRIMRSTAGTRVFNPADVVIDWLV